MDTAGASPWKLGLIPQAIANGLSSILILFFLLSDLHGGLLDVGLVAAVTALALIPSQIVWGRLVDSVGRCKPFLILGFVGMGVSLAAIPLVGNVALLLGLVSLKSVLYAATVPARQLLTVESERREGWKRGLANMQFLTALGETIGMGIGAVTVSVFGLGQLFLACGALCLFSAMLLAVVAREPGFMIQRRLVALERTTSTLVAMSDYVGYARTRPWTFDSGRILETLNRSTKYLMLGIFSFSLAGSALFSPLPAYFLQFFSSGSVFFVFFGGSLVGTLCYLAVGRSGQSSSKSLILATSGRVIVIPFLLLATLGPIQGLVAAVAVLAMLEAVWSVFDVSSMFAFLETAQVGQAGFYGALIGLGAAGGGVLGGLVSSLFGFAPLFVICSGICAVAMVAFLAQYRGSQSPA